MAYLLLFSVFVVATCGLVYELISGALASYLLGDSVTQFSTVIGVYLFSMGIGSFLSKYVTRNLIAVFIQVEILIGLVGGFSAAILFLSFEHVASFRVLLYFLVSVTGTFVGLEIPLLMRILKRQFEFKDLVSQVFTFDYVGALLASLLFPLVLVPHLGLVRSAFLFGILNVAVAVLALNLLGKGQGWSRPLKGVAYASLVVLALGFAYSERVLAFSEASTYPDPVIYSKTTKYQRIILTKAPQDLRLYLNGNLQFSSRDEYRYHEALVHMGMASLHEPRDVLVLGGGDGLAVREVLKYGSVRSVTLVDLDKEMTGLFTDNEALRELNHSALVDPRVAIVTADAFVWLRGNDRKYDFVIVDFPDPSNFSIGKLYSDSFYRLLRDAIRDTGAMVVQSTSPYVAKKSFWIVDSTLRSVGLFTTPYHAMVPSFGEWGFVWAGKRPYRDPIRFPAGLKFVNGETLPALLQFPEDMKFETRAVNRLNNQVLVRTFEEEWSAYLH